MDWIVLAQSSKFVGFGPSTFSFMLKQYRTLNGRAESWLTDFDSVGSKALFESAGSLI